MCTYLKNFPRGTRDVRMSCEREEQLKHSRSWKFLMAEVFLSFSNESTETLRHESIELKRMDWVVWSINDVLDDGERKKRGKEKVERLNIWRLSLLSLSLSKILSLKELLVWIREKTQHSHDSLKRFFLPFWKTHKILFSFPIHSHSFHSPQSFYTLSLIISFSLSLFMILSLILTFSLSLFMILSLSPVVPLTFIEIPVHPSLKIRVEENDSFRI